MILDRSFHSQKSVDLRSYIERIDPDLCHICKDRKHGDSYYLSDDQLPVCDVCTQKIGSGTRTGFVEYIEDISELSSKTIDLTKIQESEKILGKVVYPEDTRLSPIEQICRISDSGFYVSPFDSRWVVTRLHEGYLVSEMKTGIGFVIYRENCKNIDLVPEKMKNHPEYVTLFPSRTFAHKVTPEQLAANTI